MSVFIDFNVKKINNLSFIKISNVEVPEKEKGPSDTSAETSQLLLSKSGGYHV